MGLQCPAVFAGGQQEKATAASGAPVVLTVWADSFFTPKWQGRQGPVLDAIWKEFEAKANVKIDLQLVPYPDFQAKLLTALAADNPPDVAIADQYWLASLVKTGGVQDISAAWPVENRKDFFQWSVDGVTVDNKVYGIWYTTDDRVLYYRKDILAENGYAALPKTWDELHAATARMTTSDRYGMGMVLSGEGGTCTLLIGHGLGGELVDSAGKPALDSGRNREAMATVMQFYKKLYDEKLIPGDSVSYMSENDMNPTIFGGGWQIGNMQDNMIRRSRPVGHRHPADAERRQADEPGGGLRSERVHRRSGQEAESGRFHPPPLQSGQRREVRRRLPGPARTPERVRHRLLLLHRSLHDQVRPDPALARTRPNSVRTPSISDSISKGLGEFISGEKSAAQAISDAQKRVLDQM